MRNSRSSSAALETLWDALPEASSTLTEPAGAGEAHSTWETGLLPSEPIRPCGLRGPSKPRASQRKRDDHQMFEEIAAIVGDKPAEALFRAFAGSAITIPTEPEVEIILRQRHVAGEIDKVAGSYDADPNARKEVIRGVTNRLAKHHGMDAKDLRTDYRAATGRRMPCHDLESFKQTATHAGPWAQLLALAVGAQGLLALSKRFGGREIRFPG
jgi:hypothetical protein